VILERRLVGIRLFMIRLVIMLLNISKMKMMLMFKLRNRI